MDEILKRLSEADRIAAAELMAKIERALAQRGRLANWLLSILEEPSIQQRIKEIANG